MGGKTFLAPITLIKFVRKAGKIDISSCYSVGLCLIIVNFSLISNYAQGIMMSGTLLTSILAT